METLRLWLSILHCTVVFVRLNLNGCRKYTVVGHWSQHNHTGITNQVDFRIRAINVSASTIWKLKEAEYYPLEDIQCNGTFSYTHCRKSGSISTGYEGTTVQWAWRGWGWWAGIITWVPPPSIITWVPPEGEAPLSSCSTTDATALRWIISHSYLPRCGY